MSNKTRNVLFYAFCLAFLILGALSILYTQGWRFNWETFSMEKVGGIFIQSHPSDANIYLDDKLVKNTSWFLQSGTFINSLFPKTYKVTLSKEGFRAWNRHVAVEPTLVAEISGAFLVPITYTTSTVTSTLKTISSTSSPLFSESLKLRANAMNGTSTGSKIFISNMGDSASTTPLKILGLPNDIARIKWNKTDLLILESDGTLTTYSPTIDASNEIAKHVKGFFLSKSNNKIAVTDNQSLQIIDFKNDQGYKRFNIPNINSVSKIEWFKDDDHIFLIFQDRVVFLDLNDSKLENMTQVASSSKATYDPILNTFYYLETSNSGDIVYALEFPR